MINKLTSGAIHNVRTHKFGIFAPPPSSKYGIYIKFHLHISIECLFLVKK